MRFIKSLRQRLEAWANHCWYQKNAFSALLLPLSFLFGLIAAGRKKAYQYGLFKRYRSIAKIIIVGNISVGGTGKTPVVIALVQYLQTLNIPVIVVSRGYGRSEKALVVVNAQSVATACGDEPLVIFQATGVPVIVARHRVDAVRYAEQYYPGHCIIADDGLQHYVLARSIEIAVIDGQRGCGNGRLLPAGPLREPLSRLEKVDFSLVNDGQWPSAYPFSLTPTRIVQLNTGQAIPFAALADKGPWLALTAIGNPGRFFASLQALNLSFIEKTFPDHYAYQLADLISFKDYAIIVTAKDAVKLSAFSLPNIYVLEVTAQLPLDFYQAFSTRLMSS